MYTSAPQCLALKSCLRICNNVRDLTLNNFSFPRYQDDCLSAQLLQLIVEMFPLLQKLEILDITGFTFRVDHALPTPQGLIKKLTALDISVDYSIEHAPVPLAPLLSVFTCVDNFVFWMIEALRHDPSSTIPTDSESQIESTAHHVEVDQLRLMWDGVNRDLWDIGRAVRLRKLMMSIFSLESYPALSINTFLSKYGSSIHTFGLEVDMATISSQQGMYSQN